MVLSYEYENKIIKFELVHRNRKTLSIQIKGKEEVLVIAPVGVSKEKVLEIVKKKSKWIVRKQLELKDIKHEQKSIDYVNNETLYYLGEVCSLDVVLDKEITIPEVRKIEGKIQVHSGSTDKETIKEALKQWYFNEARECIEGIILDYQSVLKVKPTKITIKDQKKRWGSCTSKEHVLFNWKLIMAPKSVIEYVVVHELCHLIHLNHSKEFWQLVKNTLPNYELSKNHLKKYGLIYMTHMG
ncbi:SprT family zinc-dependent metalloprotease [Serpentinicella sp. ANB-PHB4]|uniref:M48 family metallopeptidase n=1 Tax=Serpentinicella sp. ANB-PHB4 TaxID=3074076 RepID=UPI002861F5DC|nr:SprT family zinc-dependent metalloprotease [Serpentinicella sp. ANB-PHB4]MDR5658959.1 SprT family zinc-dependent metalloprotease [Serpentinicella sp. ANB-PHB4]